MLSKGAQNLQQLGSLREPKVKGAVSLGILGARAVGLYIVAVRKRRRSRCYQEAAIAAKAMRIVMRPVRQSSLLRD